MICRNPSETVTHLVLLNQHIYSIITPISKLYVHLLLLSVYISCVYNPAFTLLNCFIYMFYTGPKCELVKY
jgi:hypothetical protein